MMRLPPFRYHAPRTAREVAEILAGEGPDAMVVAGGTDLYPNMKRRHQMPKTVVSLRRVAELRGIERHGDGSFRIGPAETLRTVERDAGVGEELPALRDAVMSISTPILRNMGTIGGNVCLDTRCNYYNQNYEWRRAINFCMKCEGDTCWVAPGSEICWAVNSSDSVPILLAMHATFRLVSTEGERDVTGDDLFAVTDGRDLYTKKPGEVMTDILIPAQNGARSIYRKLRRRGAFDFPVLGVAARIHRNGGRNGIVESADLVLGAVGPAPIRVTEAEAALAGKPLDQGAILKAAALAKKASRPLDNTDYLPQWRKKMVPVFVRRALEELA
jgi:4-hydroxybenzoyl-CoA reductase subunit beta